MPIRLESATLTIMRSTFLAPCFAPLLLLAGCSSSTVVPTDTTGGDADSAVSTSDGASADGSGDDTSTSADAVGSDGGVTDSGSSSDVVATDAVGGDSTATDAVSSDGGCSDCIPSALNWGTTGGFVASTDTSTLSTCHTFQATRASRTGGPPTTCSNDVPACGAGGVTLEEVLAALSQSDVVAALKANTLYGRVFPDAGEFTISYAGGTIRIAMDCAGAAGCTPPTANVKALQALLQKLTKQQIGLDPCKATFPGGFG
jgi:hypothetical protein